MSLLDETNYVLPLRPIGHRRRRAIIRVLQANILPICRSDDIVSVLRQSADPEDEVDWLATMWASITGSPNIDTGIVGNLGDVNVDACEKIIAWHAIPYGSPFRRIAAHAAHFVIYAGSENRPLLLVLFLQWFNRMYQSQSATQPSGIKRVGFMFVQQWIIGVVLCDNSVDVASDMSSHNLYRSTLVSDSGLLLYAQSSNRDANVEGVATTVSIAVSYGRLMGYGVTRVHV
ncbi:hypothetical protein CONPUDRAFT_72259 [Coniophora puteana RWD-64-598 SS2]|uniref:Uncharacterized protein n=1 Tax=Coniophora puteana (strain RWD-64-598) TaxID=741705 RepID=A0A5M3MS12_CONPW|nr:uncharacterized protein CONPUDRAFT_72259 [Coniophora puteana RWD-64-598 SS2]EIW81890.1 hypothetical protein CONPUDRAFT_72259 [Coniophora puteana RWD-64-598 SS2]